jgi:hypothetical protein
VEAAREEAGAVERPEVGHFLDYAEQARVAARIGADGAGIDRIDIAADAAHRQALVDLLESAQQRRHDRFPLLQQMQHRAPGGAGPSPGKRASACVSASISGDAMPGRYAGAEALQSLSSPPVRAERTEQFKRR